MSFLSDALSSIGLANNWLIILVFLVIGFGYGFIIGKNRLYLIMLASYFSFVITKAIPWMQLGFSGTKQIPDSNVQVFLFLGIVLAIFFVAPHSGMASSVHITGRGRAKWWQLAMLGILQLGFLISAVVSFLSAKTILDFGPQFKQFFVDPLAQFLWIFLPIVAMLVLKRRRAYSYGRGDE